MINKPAVMPSPPISVIQRELEEMVATRIGSVLITGADGMLGRAFIEALAPLAARLRVHAYSHAQLDVTDRQAIMSRVSDHPDIILHCAGLALADQCERDPSLAEAVHLGGTVNIGALARATSARVFYPQSVFIFDGRELPVTEDTVPAPQFAYGRVKLAAERHLLAELPGTLVVRMAGFFGGDHADKNFVGQFTRQLAGMLARGETSCAVGDRVWQPTYTLDLARNTLLLLARGRNGIYHMGSRGEATFAEVARTCVEELGLSQCIRVQMSSADVFDSVEAAPRPRRMVTANERLDREGLNRQRPWREALAEYLQRPYFASLRQAREAAP